MVKCLSGHCRYSVNDCPQELSCPSERSFKCQDGQCVGDKESCAAVDNQMYDLVSNCLLAGLLPCPGAA
jgi:hypothetical protein